MAYFETTIIKDKDLKDCDTVFNYLQGLLFDTANVLMVAHEKSSTSDNYHFHVLIDDFNNSWNISLLYDTFNKVFRQVQSFEKTVSYFKKDGKFKLYNGFVLPDNKSKVDMALLIADIKLGFTYSDLVLKYGAFVLKNAYGINILIRDLTNKR